MVVALVGAAFWFRQGAPPADVVLGDSVAAATGSEATPAPPPARIATWRPGAPRSIHIGRLGITSPVQPIHVVGSALIPPSDPDVLGWWADGARPGDPRGSVLVTGHTVSTGGAALDRLEELRPVTPSRFGPGATPWSTPYAARRSSTRGWWLGVHSGCSTKRCRAGWCSSPAETGTARGTAATSWSLPSRSVEPASTIMAVLNFSCGPSLTLSLTRTTAVSQ